MWLEENVMLVTMNEFYDYTFLLAEPLVMTCGCAGRVVASRHDA